MGEIGSPQAQSVVINNMAAVTSSIAQNEANTVEVVCPSEEELRCLPDKDNICPIDECAKTLKNSSALKLHLIKVHKVGTEKEMILFNKSKPRENFRVERQFYCPVEGCPRNKNHNNRPFKKLSFLRLHYMNVHADKIFNCSKCKKSFGNPKRLLLHEETCGRLFNCSCGTPYSTKEALLTHARRKRHNVTIEKKSKGEKCSGSQVVTVVIRCNQSFIPILPKPNVKDASTSSNSVTSSIGTQRTLEGLSHDLTTQIDAGSVTDSQDVFETAKRIHKQTSEVSDEVTEAFTQTRFNSVENQSCQTMQCGSVRLDNHTQTPISLNEYILEFDAQFGNTSVPDLASACTQTAESSMFRDLLDCSTQETQTQASVDDYEMVEMNSSCTQTLFNDLISDGIPNSTDLTISNDMETQTYLLGDSDLLSNQSFSQT